MPKTHTPHRGAGAPRTSRRPCDVRCMYAQPGSPCSCSCGGVNHALGSLQDAGQESLFDTDHHHQAESRQRRWDAEIADPHGAHDDDGSE